MKGFVLSCGLIVSLAAASNAQTWKSKQIGSLSPEVATQKYNSTFPGPHTMEIKTGVDLYKLNYTANDGKGPVGASGLLALPKNGAPKGLVVFFNGTQTDRRLSPSNYDGLKKDGETEAAVLAFTVGGYAVAIPDTFGMGDDNRMHPYVQGSINCQAGIDMISPARAAAQQAKITLDSRLYVSGYSEGGLNAMWMVRKLELLRAPGFAPDMAAPMSGPYDLSDSTFQRFMKVEPDPIIRGFMLLATAYTVLGAKAQQPEINLEDYFIPEYAKIVEDSFKQPSTMEQLGLKLLLSAGKLGATESIRPILNPKFLKSVEEGHADDPVVKMLQANNCFDWKPRTKLLLPFLRSDQIVPAENTIKTTEAMNSTGRVFSIEISGTGLNHGTAFIPALMQTRQFFDGGFAGAGLKTNISFLTGQVTYRERIALPKEAIIHIRLEDSSLADAPAPTISETSVYPDGQQVPVPFSLEYDASRIENTHRYNMRCWITAGGKLLFHTTQAYPVLTNGNGTKVELVLHTAAATPPVKAPTTKPPVPTPPIAKAPTTKLPPKKVEPPKPAIKLTFINKVWMVSESAEVQKGQLYTFLSEGTLVVASKTGKPSLGKWKVEKGKMTMTEQGISYPVEILESTDKRLKLKIVNARGSATITLIPAS